MRYHIGGFNAPSRELIYRRAMELINGSSYTYNFEDFVAFDVNYRNSIKIEEKKSVIATSAQLFIPYSEPTITF